MFKKAKDSLLFIIIGAIILMCSFVSLIMPDKIFSENENKVLATLPAVSVETLLNGKFATDYEAYVADHFIFRDEWIAAKSISEFMLLKTENNGVVYGKDGYMFPKFSSFDETRMLANLDAIDTFAYKVPCEVSMIVVPSSFSTLREKVPAGLPTVDEGFFINQIQDYLKNTINSVDAKAAFSNNTNDYIYYRTDHHWTSLGAHLVYSEFIKSIGLTPIQYDSLSPVTVNGFLGTSYSKSKAFNAKADSLTYFPELDCVSLTSNNKTQSTLYNLEQFKKRDKYSGLLFGNSSLIEIETAYSGAKRDSILIIRDSYADSLVPYLTNHYNHITLVDPRYYILPFSNLAEQDFTDVLILFGFENLVGEKSIIKLGL